MAFPWLAIAAGASVVSSLFGAVSSRKAASETEALGQSNASYILQETAEQSRRLRFEQDQVRAGVRTAIASSGFHSGRDTIGASHKAYQKTMAQVQSSELSWLQKSGKSRADIALRGGQSQATQLRSQAVGLFGSAVTSAAKSIYQWGQT